MMDLKLIRIAAPFCVAVALGACSTEKEWAHPANGIKTTQADLSQCETSARRESWRSGAIDSFTNTRYAGVQDARTYNEPLHRVTQNPYVTEVRMRDLCMEAKGYKSVAVVNGEPQWGPDQLQYAGKQSDPSQLVGVKDDKPPAQ